MRRRLVQALLDERVDGVWEGELSTSALSTATAIAALHRVDPKAHADLIAGGLAWLATNQNTDGGWGDTVDSLSNISTSALCWAALACRAGNEPALIQSEQKAEAWLTEKAGGLEPDRLRKAIMARYGKDHTFSIPILTMLAIRGRLGPSDQAWRLVAPLPFELAAIPRRFYKTVRLPVVSYALPALIAIGQVIHHRRGTRNPITALLRRWTEKPTLRLLQKIQPESGGFLEAIPLTAFVIMSLAEKGIPDHPVAQKGITFLRDLVRPDGSWPIDTHLQTWVTTLAINALGDEIPEPDREHLTQWLLDTQYKETHPYTGAAPGGWAWTPLSGGVPDADDTSGAILALATLNTGGPEVETAARAGIDWLVDLQNSDGGIPTFCKGWGTLPFDKSCPDITAHALRAIHTWRNRGLTKPNWQRATKKMLRYLTKTQQPNGSWVPLWFGNQHHPDEQNPTYGTAKVIKALTTLDLNHTESTHLTKATAWLLSTQHPNGGWGSGPNTPTTIEETALALEALQSLPNPPTEPIARGRDALADLTDEGRHWPTSPIGFYFANLWYSEKLYPLLFACSGVGRFTAPKRAKAGHARESLGRQSKLPPRSATDYLAQTSAELETMKKMTEKRAVKPLSIFFF